MLLFSSVDGVVVVVLVVLVWLLVLISRVGVVCSGWFGGFGLGRLGFWAAVGLGFVWFLVMCVLARFWYFK